MGIYRCVCITCRYEVAESLTQQTWRACISKALASVVSNQPLLRVGIAGEDTNAPSFTHAVSIDLDNHVRWHSVASESDEENELIRAVVERHEALWPDIANRPPWAVTIVGTPGRSRYVDIVFAWHHAIGDGLSGQIFHKNLLQALRETEGSMDEKAAESSILSYPEPPVLPPPQEDAVNLSIGWWYMLKTLWAELRPAFLAPPALKPWTGAPVHLESTYKTNVRIVTVDGKTVSSILTLCRMHNTTLTGLIQTLILTSFARQLPDETVFVSQTPISLRPYASAEGWDFNKSMLVLVTTLHHRFTPEHVSELQTLLAKSPEEAGTSLEDMIWELAAHVKKELKDKTQSLPANDIMGLLKWVPDWHERMRKMDGKPRETTWEVSNVGVIGDKDDSAEGNVKISRQVFTQSAILTGAAMCASVAGSKSSGTVTIGLTWQEGVIDAKMVEGIKADLEKWFENLGASGKLR
ncbi:hypothetical protein jhhlp_006839 [Lomentospora prolificans]|uniref:Diacylglycerol O-acyltransferase n=1 Tax=Lomentospora prolificans TaxID=41688 RepID=A0A2N3N2V0_9PEZI|nr:hypothetical protein jhhlp_006839 [Lomentospora prolificans]